MTDPARVLILASVVWMALPADAAGPGEGLSLEDVVRANRDAVRAIRSLSVKIRMFRGEPNSTGPATIATETLWSAWNEDRERQILDYFGARPSWNGDRLGYSDTSKGPEGYRTVIGYDPAHPTELGESSLSRAYALQGTGEYGPKKLSSRPRGMMLLAIVKVNETWTLDELVKIARSARLMADPATSPRGCYEIAIDRGDDWFQVSIDPAHHFLIRRIEYRAMKGAWAKLKIRYVVEVTRFQDCGEGVELPAEIVGVGGERDRPMSHRSEIEILSCNQDLPADTFLVSYPDWLRVFDRDTGAIHVWGPDGKPRLSFANSAEYDRWWRPRQAAAEQLLGLGAGGIPGWAWTAGTLGVVLAVLLIVMFLQRRRGRLA